MSVPETVVELRSAPYHSVAGDYMTQHSKGKASPATARSESHVGRSRMRWPDFYIAGAMKCGTTSLHHILAAHPRVFMLAGEPRYFAIDDLQQLPEHIVAGSKQWFWPGAPSAEGSYAHWYQNLFADAPEGSLVGEDSPVYLASAKAPARIASRTPQARLIFLLRDPVARAWSHYLHWVKSGRATYAFGDQIRYSPDSLLQRGLYREQLERYYGLFPRSQIKVVISEEFFAEPLSVIRDTLLFLGLSEEWDPSSSDFQFNIGLQRARPSLLLLRNRIYRNRINESRWRQLCAIPEIAEHGWVREPVWRALTKLSHRFGTKIEPMDPKIRRFLTEFYNAENQGLSDLIQLPLDRWWPSVR